MAVKQLSDGGADGVSLGQSITDKVGFYGTTPATQPADADQAAGTTDTFSLTASYNSAIIITSLTALLDEVNAIRSALVTLGLIKGSA